MCPRSCCINPKKIRKMFVFRGLGSSSSIPTIGLTRIGFLLCQPRVCISIQQFLWPTHATMQSELCLRVLNDKNSKTPRTHFFPLARPPCPCPPRSTALCVVIGAKLFSTKPRLLPSATPISLLGCSPLATWREDTQSVGSVWVAGMAVP
jgi:hypothetical protein